MGSVEKTVDGFKFLPPSLAAWIRDFISKGGYDGFIPWTPLSKPLKESTLALITSGGISLRTEAPFDMEREKKEPTWGDRSYRSIPRDTSAADITARHLHINTDFCQKDINVILPLARMAELEREGIIGRLADTSYSFYGFQWQSTEFVTEAIEPMSAKMKEEGVDAVILTPA